MSVDELQVALLELLLAEIELDVVFQVVHDSLVDLVALLVVVHPNLQAVALNHGLTSLLLDDDTRNALVLIVSDAGTVATHNVEHHSLPNQLQLLVVFDVAKVQSDLAVVPLVLKLRSDAVLEHHHRVHLVVVVLKVFEHLELLSVAKDVENVGMRYAIPDLVEGDYVSEPSYLSAELVVVSSSPLLLGAVIVNEFPNGPFDTLYVVSLDLRTYMCQVKLAVLTGLSKLVLREVFLDLEHWVVVRIRTALCLLHVGSSHAVYVGPVGILLRLELLHLNID